MDDSEYETMGDVPASEPAGVTRVEVSVPTPTLEQVAGEMARQILRGDGGYDRPSLKAIAEQRINDLIADKVAEKATVVIEDLLSKPMQKTDGYGNPVGEPVSLAAVIADEVNSWASVPVDGQGRMKTRDSYGGGEWAPRINWLIKQTASRDLDAAVSKEVERIKSELKAAATQGIARQIAEKVAAMVLK